MYTHSRHDADNYSGKHDFICEREHDFVFRAEPARYFAVLKTNKFSGIAGAVGEASRRKASQLPGAPSSQEAWHNEQHNEQHDEQHNDQHNEQREHNEHNEHNEQLEHNDDGFQLEHNDDVDVALNGEFAGGVQMASNVSQHERQLELERQLQQLQLKASRWKTACEKAQRARSAAQADAQKLPSVQQQLASTAAKLSAARLDYERMKQAMEKEIESHGVLASREAGLWELNAKQRQDLV